MTDKQIIIDDQKKTIHRLQDECTEKTNAIIALGEQLDQLKFDYAELEKRHNDSFEQFKQLKAENDELKKKLMQKSEVDMFFNTPIEGWSSDPCGVCKYKNYLAEIKEIAEKLKNFYEELGKCEGLTVVRLKQILQKISECEGNDEYS